MLLMAGVAGLNAESMNFAETVQPNAQKHPLRVSILLIGGLTMIENKMAEVAEIFGKKLNEPFTAYELGGSKNHISMTSNGEPIGNHVMFSERGVVYVDVPEDEQNWLLINLLTGKAEIVEDER